jgi:hypothetical protein
MLNVVMLSVVELDVVMLSVVAPHSWPMGLIPPPYMKCLCFGYYHLVVISDYNYWGCIFSHVWPFYEQAVSDLDPKRSMNRPVWVTHRSFIEGSHTTKNTASVLSLVTLDNVCCDTNKNNPSCIVSPKVAKVSKASVTPQWNRMLWKM